MAQYPLIRVDRRSCSDSPNIRVEINAAAHPNRIALRIPPTARVVHARPVVGHAALRIQILTGETQTQTTETAVVHRLFAMVSQIPRAPPSPSSLSDGAYPCFSASSQSLRTTLWGPVRCRPVGAACKARLPRKSDDGLIRSSYYPCVVRCYGSDSTYRVSAWRAAFPELVCAKSTCETGEFL